MQHSLTIPQRWRTSSHSCVVQRTASTLALTASAVVVHLLVARILREVVTTEEIAGLAIATPSLVGRSQVQLASKAVESPAAVVAKAVVAMATTVVVAAGVVAVAATRSDVDENNMPDRHGTVIKQFVTKFWGMKLPDP